MLRDQMPNNTLVTRLLVAGLLTTVVVAFWVAPLPGGDDWEFFQTVARGLFKSTDSLYGEKVTHGYYSNPPWLVVGLIPLSVLPFKLGWAVLSVITLGAALIILRRWQPLPGLVKPALVLLSPAMIYTLLHGQIDMLVISGILLPEVFWPLVALTKPQVAIGLAMGVPREQWHRAALLTCGVLVLSLLFFGFWPRDLIEQPTPFVDATHNLWLGLWPFQLPAGVMVILVGISRRDERLLVAGSPLLSPYAAMSSLLGPWLAAITFLTDWQALAVFASWWGAVIYRGIAV